MTGDRAGQLPDENPGSSDGGQAPPPSRPPYVLIALGLAAIAVIVAVAVVLLGGGDDSDGSAAVAQSPTAARTSVASTQPPAVTATRPATTQTSVPTGRTIAADRLPLLVISDAERTRITGRGAFSQVRTNVTDTSLPFSSSAPTGAFLAGQGTQTLYNVWQATALTESGIFNIASILLHFPSSQAAMATGDHLSQVYQTVFQNGERLPGQAGLTGFCQRGEVVASNGQRTYWVFCGGQKDNVIVGVSVGSVRAIDIATVRPAIDAYFQRAGTTLG